MWRKRHRRAPDNDPALSSVPSGPQALVKVQEKPSRLSFPRGTSLHMHCRQAHAAGEHGTQFLAVDLGILGRHKGAEEAHAEYLQLALEARDEQGRGLGREQGREQEDRTLREPSPWHGKICDSKRRVNVWNLLSVNTN